MIPSLFAVNGIEMFLLIAVVPLAGSYTNVTGISIGAKGSPFELILDTFAVISHCFRLLALALFAGISISNEK